MIFSDGEFLLKDFVHFIPTENNPRSEDEKEQAHKESEKSRIEENGYTENDTDNSELKHRRKVNVKSF